MDKAINRLLLLEEFKQGVKAMNEGLELMHCVDGLVLPQMSEAMDVLNDGLDRFINAIKKIIEKPPEPQISSRWTQTDVSNEGDDTIETSSAMALASASTSGSRPPQSE